MSKPPSKAQLDYRRRAKAVTLARDHLLMETSRLVQTIALKLADPDQHDAKSILVNQGMRVQAARAQLQEAHAAMINPHLADEG